MSAKEELISELGFLDEMPVVAMDEKVRNQKKASRRNEEVPDTSIDESLLNAIEGLSDGAALAVLSAYRSIPKEVKDAVKAVYDALGILGGETSMEDLKDALKALKETCGEEYEGLYESAVRDAKKYVPKIQTRLLTESIDE